jgi:pimeloyl-ACP methyl ester carboxylesterase
MRNSSKEVAAFVDRVRASTGAPKVNIGAHSMGTTVNAYYMKFDGGNATVAHFVGFGANYKGTTMYGREFRTGGADPVNKLINALPVVRAVVDAFCQSCTEFLPPNAFLDDLNAGGVTVPGPDYTTIASRLDELVIPPSSGILDEPGVTNVWLQDKCAADLAGHFLQAVDPNVLQIMRWAFAGKPGPMPTGCSLNGAYP